MATTTNSVIPIEPKLKDRKSYGLWAFKMERVLEARGIWNVVGGDTVTTPSTDDPALPSWKERDAKARAQIALYVEDALVISIMKAKSAHLMWEILRTLFAEQNSLNQSLVESQFYSVRMSPGQDVKLHLDLLQDLYNEAVAVGSPLEDKILVHRIITSLTSDYDSLISSITDTSKVTSEQLIARIMLEDQRR
ncbi:hypothetical protein HETIRDRAFT_232534, partial [Heterobasidion irregulare TC 32-1]